MLSVCLSCWCYPTVILTSSACFRWKCTLTQPYGVYFPGVYGLLGCMWVYVLYTRWHHMASSQRSSEMWQRAGKLSSATWKDIFILDDVGFGKLEPVFSHGFLVSVLPLAPSCGCCLPPLFSLDQDETEWDSALSLLHPPCHIPTLDVGLPISIILSHPAAVFGGWRKCVSH